MADLRREMTFAELGLAESNTAAISAMSKMASAVVSRHASRSATPAILFPSGAGIDRLERRMF
jgi:hypothetical protein